MLYGIGYIKTYRAKGRRIGKIIIDRYILNEMTNKSRTNIKNEKYHARIIATLLKGQVGKNYTF